MDDDVLTRLRQAVSRLARELNTTATDEGLTPTQASTLGVIARRGPISLSELARVERLNPTMLSRVIAKLDGAGLIARTPHPEDQRSALVEVTPQGRTTSTRIRNNRTKEVAHAAESLPAAQQRLLTDAVPALEALFEQLRAREP